MTDPKTTPTVAYQANGTVILDIEKNEFITDLGGALRGGLAATVTLEDVNTVANGAVTDAATADGKAVTAQSTADGAVTDAATAQSTADGAVTDAATAQSTADGAAVRPITMTTDTEAWSSIGAGIIDFTGHNELIIVINPAITGTTVGLTISGLPDSGKRWLKITKSSGLTLTFSGVSYESLNNSDTSYYLEITCIDGSFYMKDAMIDGSLGGLKMKRLTFSGWDMQTTDSIDVAHGLTQSKIIGVTTNVYSATVSIMRDISHMEVTDTKNGGSWQVGSTYVTLDRIVSQHWDNVLYNDASGHIIVFYIE